jgi:predicted phosphate transport protein (TIGR00153 family)
MAVPAYFSGIFGKSPFPSLQKHAAICAEASEVLLQLVPAANAARWDEVEQLYDTLTRLEHKADKQKRNIRSKLPRGFFLPVARADLLDLLSRQDEIANDARDIAGLMLGRRMQFPQAVQSGVFELIEAAVATCIRVRELVGLFDELLDTGFSGLEAKRVAAMIEEVEQLEANTDVLVVGIRKKLFEVETELAPVQAIFFYRVLDMIAELADGAERVAHRVQMMIAK